MNDKSKPDYYGGPPDENFTAATEPFSLFSTWLADAKDHEINDPNAMALATVDGDGLPNVRMVLLKGVDADGFVFYTNTQSAKGGELQNQHKAAICFHWKSLRRQVRARGAISPVSAEEADAYYASRPRGSRIGAWASDQSRPLGARGQLEDAVKAYEAKFEGTEDIPRPPHWSGFRLVPQEIELWHDRPYRLHERVRFTRTAPDEAWSTSMLYP
ncbi:MAG: pyridoxamine 5'-phosphate oxidase [Pseudomonadota bacterium]